MFCEEKKNNNTSGKADEILQKYKDECVKGKNGAILFAVSRAKYDEGYNFPDDLCRAVVAVGKPNPYIYLKKYILLDAIAKRIGKKS